MVWRDLHQLGRVGEAVDFIQNNPATSQAAREVRDQFFGFAIHHMIGVRLQLRDTAGHAPADDGSQSMSLAARRKTQQLLFVDEHSTQQGYLSPLQVRRR